MPKNRQARIEVGASRGNILRTPIFLVRVVKNGDAVVGGTMAIAGRRASVFAFPRALGAEAASTIVVIAALGSWGTPCR